MILGSFADSLIRFRGPLIARLRNQRHRVIACAPDASRDVIDSLVAMGAEYRNVPIQRARLNPFADLRTFLSLWCLFLKLRPDVLFAYTIKPVVYGSLAARLAGVPNRFAMITGLGFAFTSGAGRLRRIASTIARQMYRVSLAGCHRVFFQNPDDLELFLDDRIIAKDLPTTLVPGSGVDITDYAHSPLQNTTDFLMIARLVRDKGVREYADAARRVGTRFPRARFKLVGWIDENPTAIKQSELDEWIRSGVLEYLGFLRDVKPALIGCAVYVLPSYREGTPRTVLEAMAVGRAILTTDAPGCRETVVNGENGFLVPVGDPVALEEAMVRLLENPTLIEKFGLKSRQIAVEKFDVRIVNDLLADGMGLQ